MILKVTLFAMGAISGFIFAKKMYEKYYADLAQEEINSVKDAYQNRVNTLVPSKEQSENEMPEEEFVFNYEEMKKEMEKKEERINRNFLTRSSLDNNFNEQIKRNYHLVNDKNNELEELEEEENEEEGEFIIDDAGKTEEEMDLTKIDRTLPYIIDDQEFMHEFDHHDKISLYYYREDDVLCDEHEEVINNIEEIIGYDALAALDMQTIVWVRNELLCCDYEIILINKSYAELIHKVEVNNLSPRELYLKRQKKRSEQDDDKE